MNLHLVCLLALLFIGCHLGQSFMIQVAPRSQECFFEELEQREKLICSYEVVSGGMLDINIRVTGPDSKVVYEHDREKEGSFQFAAMKKGTYQVCFSNSMSTLTLKTVSFNIYTGSELHRYQNAKSDHLQPLDKAVMTLTESVRRMTDGYHYIRSRVVTCGNTALSSRSRVYYWGAINVLLAIGAFLLRTLLIVRPFQNINAKPVYNYQYQGL